MEKKIGVVGFGNMGSAIVERIKSKYKVFVFDRDFDKTKNIPGIEVAGNNIALINKVDTIILAVKPQDFDSVLTEIRGYLKDKPVISIAAGITTAYIEKNLGPVRVVRAMPNIGVKIGEAQTAFCGGKFATVGDLAFTQELFNCLGKAWKVEEKMINPSTAISGSGPAYIFEFIESNNIDPANIPEQTKKDIVRRLAKAAVAVGFNSQDAMELALDTSVTSINLMNKMKLPASVLRQQVASKGGTTEAGLVALRKTGSWEEAAKAALRRAEELNKKE